MKTLSTLMMNEFIAMSCGNLSIVLEEGESYSEDEIKQHVNKLLFDYKMLVNPVGMKIVLSQEKQNSLRTARIYLLRMCTSLLDMKSYDDVREIVNEMGWHCEKMSIDDLDRKVKSELRRLEYESKRSKASQDSEKEQNEASPQEIISMFDKEQAALMTYFKMCISMDSITAAVYANMVAQAEREIAIRNKSLGH